MPTFVLIGHCGPDSYLLKSAISRAVAGASVVFADSDAELRPHLNAGNVVLVNRLLESSSFETGDGVELIQRLHAEHPGLRLLLVSNFAEAQERARAVGALPGFGKREVNTSRVTELLRRAVEAPTGSTIHGD